MNNRTMYILFFVIAIALIVFALLNSKRTVFLSDGVREIELQLNKWSYRVSKNAEQTRVIVLGDPGLNLVNGYIEQFGSSFQFHINNVDVRATTRQVMGMFTQVDFEILPTAAKAE